MDFYELDEKLAKSIESEESALEWDICKGWEKGEVDVDSAAKFSIIMHGASLGPANYLANTIDLEKKYQIKSLLDVGGGSGCYSIAFAKYQPNVKTIVLDLPAVCEVAQTFIQKANLSEASTVLTYASDMFRQPLPDCTDSKYGYQAILLSQICHDWSREDNMELLRKCFAALPSKGCVLIHEALLNDDGSGPLDIAMYSLDMFLMSKGRQYKSKEFKQMLEETGYVNYEVIKVFGMYSLVIGMKP